MSKASNVIDLGKQREVNKIIGDAVRKFGLKAKDPNHPWHDRLTWQDGLPCLPTSDAELAALVLAALDDDNPSE